MTRPRVTWTAERDGQAYAATSQRLRTPCGLRPRCVACLAAVEEVAPAKRR